MQGLASRRLPIVRRCCRSTRYRDPAAAKRDIDYAHP